MINLGKDIYNAQHRILDHRVFSNGEIDSFVNNIELKRNDIEVETLFKVTEITGELKYITDRCTVIANNQLPTLSDSVRNLLFGVQNFFAKSQEQREPNRFLVNARPERDQRKNSFNEDIDYQYKRVDNSFEEKEDEIIELYSDLQRKLNILK